MDFLSKQICFLMLKVNNKNIKNFCEICLNLTIMTSVNDVDLVSLLLTLNILIFFYCLYFLKVKFFFFNLDCGQRILKISGCFSFSISWLSKSLIYVVYWFCINTDLSECQNHLQTDRILKTIKKTTRYPISYRFRHIVFKTCYQERHQINKFVCRHLKYISNVGCRSLFFAKKTPIIEISKSVLETL